MRIRASLLQFKCKSNLFLEKKKTLLIPAHIRRKKILFASHKSVHRIFLISTVSLKAQRELLYMLQWIFRLQSCQVLSLSLLVSRSDR